MAVPLWQALVVLCLGFFHKRGYLRWVKEEWFTLAWLWPRAKQVLGLRVTREELAAGTVCEVEVEGETKKAA